MTRDTSTRRRSTSARKPRTKPNAARSARDAYFTPHFLTEALFDVLAEEITGRVWEPCAGAGWMSEVLARHCEVVASDLVPLGDPALGIRQHDFLSPEVPDWAQPVDWVITNPPFLLATKIFLRARQVAQKVALHVNINWLEGTGDRLPVLPLHPPDRIVILPRARYVRPDGVVDKGTPNVPPCWCVWGVTPGPICWAGHDRKAQLKSAR